MRLFSHPVISFRLDVYIISSENSEIISMFIPSQPGNTATQYSQQFVAVNRIELKIEVCSQAFIFSK
jgi:hypothetical protein